jgi:dihydrofolate reductase
MPVLHAIVAMSENRAIAYEGKMPWHLPLEYRWFKHKTMGGALIMGRKTFQSLPAPLPGRETYVLSRKPGIRHLAKSYGDAAFLVSDLPGDRTVWVCGGAEIYRLFLPLCASLYLTRVKRTAHGDTFFPPFEDQFALDQRIYENDDFVVERWLRNGLPAEAPEPWPFV